MRWAVLLANITLGVIPFIAAAQGPFTPPASSDSHKGLRNPVGAIVKPPPSDDMSPSSDLERRKTEARTAAPLLENWLVTSRDSAKAGSRPMPPDVRSAMGAFYENRLLDRVRYKIGEADALNAANLLMTYGTAVAVTLIDLIVFKTESDANDLTLWAHELRHVRQFADWNVREFAYNYIFDYRAVENEALGAQQAYLNTLRMIGFSSGKIPGNCRVFGVGRNGTQQAALVRLPQQQSVTVSWRPGTIESVVRQLLSTDQNGRTEVRPADAGGENTLEASKVSIRLHSGGPSFPATTDAVCYRVN